MMSYPPSSSVRTATTASVSRAQYYWQDRLEREYMVDLSSRPRRVWRLLLIMERVQATAPRTAWEHHDINFSPIDVVRFWPFLHFLLCLPPLLHVL